MGIDIDTAVERSRARDVDLANIDCDEKTLSELMEEINANEIFLNSADYLLCGLDDMHIANLWVAVKNAALAQEHGDERRYSWNCDRAMKLLLSSVEGTLR